MSGPMSVSARESSFLFRSCEEVGRPFRASREWAGNGAGGSDLQAAPKHSYLEASCTAGLGALHQSKIRVSERSRPNLHWANVVFTDANGRRSERFGPRALPSAAL